MALWTERRKSRRLSKEWKRIKQGEGLRISIGISRMGYFPSLSDTPEKCGELKQGMEAGKKTSLCTRGNPRVQTGSKLESYTSQTEVQRPLCWEGADKMGQGELILQRNRRLGDQHKQLVRD